MSEREALRAAIGGVLVNATNYPDRVAPRILGEDMGPLIDRTVDALLAAGFGDVTTVAAERDAARAAMAAAFAVTFNPTLDWERRAEKVRDILAKATP